MSEYAYFANATLDDGTDIGAIDLEEQGWASKPMLARTRRWSLVPKGTHVMLDGRQYPMVTIDIPVGAKPVFRSRVFVGNITGRSSDQIERKVIPHLSVPAFRVYGIGWKKGSLTVWTWVAPNGAVETTSSDECWVGTALRTHLNTITWEEPEPEPEPAEEEEPTIDPRLNEG